MEIDVSKCKHYYEYPTNDIECNNALESDNCKKVCNNKDCKWSLCDENTYCEYKVTQYLQQLKEHCKQVDETNKILYQDKCDLIKENENLDKDVQEKFNTILKLEDEIKSLQEKYETLKSDNLSTIQELDNERRLNEAYKQSEVEGKEIIAELKADNKELIKRQNVFNILKTIDKYKQCTDKIEKEIKGLCKRCALDFKVEDPDSIPNKEYCDDAHCYNILQLIQETKEDK